MVTLPDGTVVRFGDMTIDQHRAVAEQAVAEMAQLMSEKAANEEAAKEYPTNP